jgi:uncharacterized protein (DUF983 family)
MEYEPRRRKVLGAILAGLCPRCRRGRIFAGAVRMNEACPHCRLRFGREHGYFTGAMYFSYGIGAPIVIAIAVVLTLLRQWLAPQISVYWIFAGSGVLFLPFAPMVFRYSRIIWIYFDRYVDPEQ